MAFIYPINTLVEAVEWLKSETNEEWSEKKIITCGVSREIVLLASVPNWLAPGRGELEMLDRDGNLSYLVSDGLIKVDSSTLTTLLKHGRATLCMVPVEGIGDLLGVDRVIDIPCLRVLRNDLELFAARRRAITATIGGGGGDLPKIADVKTVPAPPCGIPPKEICTRGDSDTAVGGDDWQTKCRKIADELHAKDIAADAWSSVSDIADRVARIAVERKIRGPQGQLTAGNILREALQGKKWNAERIKP